MIDKKFEEGYVELFIKGVKVRWAKVQPHQGDSFQGAPEKWCIDVCLGDTLAKDLKKQGFLVKGEKGDYFITPKSAKFEKDGVTQKRPITIVGRDGKTQVTEELGNGTVVNIKIGARKWPSVSKISTYINAIQVLNLVEFNSVGGFESVEEDSDEPNF